MINNNSGNVCLHIILSSLSVKNTRSKDWQPFRFLSGGSLYKRVSTGRYFHMMNAYSFLSYLIIVVEASQVVSDADHISY